MPLRVDLSGDSATAFDGAALSLDLARVGTAPIATMKLSMTPGATPLRRVATTILAISSLPADDYVLTVRLRTAGGAEATTSRLFVKR